MVLGCRFEIVKDVDDINKVIDDNDEGDEAKRELLEASEREQNV